MPKVSRRGGFSDRNKIKPENTEIQLKTFDERTRIQLQNMILKLYDEIYVNNNDWERQVQQFYMYILDSVYSLSIDVRENYKYDDIFRVVNDTIQNAAYDDVLTLIEAIIQYWEEYLEENAGYLYYKDKCKYDGTILYQIANNYFEKEYVGYRFVDKIIVPISDQIEVNEIVEALKCDYEAVRKHISKANILLADRDTPDYENSIKESISAVEAICEIITETKGKEATLGNMLKKLEENEVAIHPGLKKAFNVLYGYASDAKGIRHAGDIGGETSTFEEAKFMLVSCCAFVNYLIAISANQRK